MFNAYLKGLNEYNKPFLLSSIENKTKTVLKKVNSIKPKGDIELKNIQYRALDKRYIGRKQIQNHIIWVYGKTQKECADKLKEQIQELTDIKNKTKDSKHFLLKDMFMSWYKQEKEPFITDGTKKDILLVFKSIEKLHEVSIKKITKQMLNDFFLKVPDNRTKEKERLYINACLEYYYKEGIIKINPCANVKVKKSYNRKPAFTYEQQQNIIQNLKHRDLEPIILLYLVTGLRKNELNFAGIENDIDFDNRLLKAVNLKGRNLVKRYKTIKLTKQTINLIMTNIDIFHKYTAESAYREFAELLNKLNIKGSIVNLRHTFATNSFYLEKQDLIISREMGHSRTQITKDVYTDIDYHLSKQKILDLYGNLYNID